MTPTCNQPELIRSLVHTHDPATPEGSLVANGVADLPASRKGCEMFDARWSLQ